MYVGLGWTVPSGMDLDVGVLVLDAEMMLISTVYFASKLYKSAIKHCGDNMTGDGAGDDERINIDLDALGPEVRHLYIVVNVFSSSGSFAKVTDAYVRLVAIKGDHELARYKLDSTVTTRGLVFASISRGPLDSPWVVSAIGKGCPGRSATDSGLHKVIGVNAALIAASRPPPPAPKGCCAVL